MFPLELQVTIVFDDWLKLLVSVDVILANLLYALHEHAVVITEIAANRGLLLFVSHKHLYGGLCPH